MVVVLGARDLILVGAQYDDVTRVVPRRVLGTRLAWLELGAGVRVGVKVRARVRVRV